MTEDAARDETSESLERIQNFDAETLPRVDDLGSSVNFQDAVEPAKRLISLYKRLSLSALQDFPVPVCQNIKSWADADFQKFQQILDFDVSSVDKPAPTRDQYIEALRNAYEPAFKNLHPYISYSLHRAADFQRLDTEARATLQAVSDKASKTLGSLDEQKEAAEAILKDIRDVAAEQGVTQMATYFKGEADEHSEEAKNWEKRTAWMAIAVIGFAIASLFLHKWAWLSPSNTYETVLLTTSKIIIFTVLTYLLILCARNYLNHKHNAIVNKHRQNALMTYRTMVDATDDPGSREAILIQAAACIYGMENTGYAPKGEGSGVSGRSMVEIMSRPVMQGAATASSTN